MHFCEVSWLDFYISISLCIILTICLVISVFYKLTKNDLRIYLVENEDQCEAACKEILNGVGGNSVLGFDTEWVTINNIRNPIALIQLCNDKKTCGLFRLNLMKQVPLSLQEVLEDPQILKVGVGIDTDSSLLLTDYKIIVTDTLDLRHLTPHRGGLAGIAEKELKLKMDKSDFIRCGNWEADELSENQTQYAAMDAYAGLQIFKKCSKTCDWKEYVNKPFKKSSSSKMSNRKRQKEGRAKHAIRNNHIYDNCIMLAPNDVLLCTTSKSKANWYLNGGKAELVKEEPLTIRLLFEPRRIPGENESLYEKVKKNNYCVVCGSSSDLIRHGVVPRRYTKYFPREIKDHCSHDILLFCHDCHAVSDSCNAKLMKELAVSAGWAPIPFPRRQCSNSARALISKHAALIPEHRKIELMEEIMEVHGLKERPTDEFLHHLATQEATNEVPGEIVVRYYSKEGRTLYDFQQLWRRHFLQTMNPKFLPEHWSVDYRNDTSCFDLAN